MKRRRKPNCFRRKKFLRLLFGHFLFRCTTLFRLQTVITRSKSTLEAIDSAFSVDVLHLTGIERVACVANIDLHLIRCRTCGKFVSATAGNFNIFVLGMGWVCLFVCTSHFISLHDPTTTIPPPQYIYIYNNPNKHFKQHQTTHPTTHQTPHQNNTPPPQYLKKQKQADYFEQLGEAIPGTALNGRRYVPLFPYFADRAASGAFQVVMDKYVTAESGTGVVHQAPAFGEDDYRVCLAHGVIEKGVDVPCPVDSNGRFTAEVGTVQKEQDSLSDWLSGWLAGWLAGWTPKRVGRQASKQAYGMEWNVSFFRHTCL